MRQELYRNRNGADLYYRHLEYYEAVDLAKTISQKRNPDYRGYASKSGNKSFTGTSNLNEAIKLAQLGWPEGISKIERYLDEIDTEELFADAINRPEIFRDIQGTAVDVAGFLQGIPEHMASLTFEQRPARAVKMIVALDQHAYVRQEDMIQKTASIFLAAEALRRAGFLLEITGVDYRAARSWGYGDGDHILYEFPILRPGDYLSSAQLAFMLGHPSFLRRILFAVNESEDSHIRDIFGFMEEHGYATPEKLDKKTLKKAGVISPDSDTAIYLIDKDDGFGDILEQAKKIMKGIKKASDKKMGFEPESGREMV